MIGAGVGYGAQVIANRSRGMDWGQALSTDIDPGKVVQGALAGAIVGTWVATGVGLVATGATAAGAGAAGGVATGVATAVVADDGGANELRAAQQVAGNAGLDATAASVRDKLLRYLLNDVHPEGASKAKWFREALGFTQENMENLARQITFDPSRAVETATTQFGVKLNQMITIEGPNGRAIEMLFVWIRDESGIVRLVTAIPAKK